MLRKFYGFRRAMVQFQYARITNDPRNQEGFGQNLGDKIKDTAQSAWDKDTEGWRAGENKAGQSTSSTTVDRREEGQDEGFSMHQKDKDLSSGSQGISGGKYGAANMDKSSSRMGMIYSGSQEGGGGAGGAGVGTQFQQPQLKNKLSSEDHSHDVGGQTKGSYSSPGSNVRFDLNERASDSKEQRSDNFPQQDRRFQQQSQQQDNQQRSWNQNQSQQSDRDRSGLNQDKGLGQQFERDQQQRFDQRQGSDIGKGRQWEQDTHKYEQRLQQEKEFNEFMPHLNRSSDDQQQNMDRFQQERGYNFRSEQLNRRDGQQNYDRNLNQQNQQSQSMGQQVVDKVQNLAGKVGEQLKGGFQTVTEKVKETLGQDQDKNKRQ